MAVTLGLSKALGPPNISATRVSVYLGTCIRLYTSLHTMQQSHPIVGLDGPITVSYTPESVGIGYSSLVGNCLILRPKRQDQANAPRKGESPRKTRT